MKRALLIIVFSVFSIPVLWAQLSPAQKLRLAKSTFESGRLHEIPGLLEKELKDNLFNSAEEVDAYKLLIQSYIYIEEPEKADQAMLDLLKAQHYFEINEAVDPAEFVALYKTFRTKPVFNVGFKIGANLTLPSVITNYYVGNSAPGTGKYGTKIGFQLGLTYEKSLFLTSTNKFLNRLTLAPEAQYMLRNFTYNNPSLFVGDEKANSVAVNDYVNKQAWIDLNVIMQYRLPFFAAINPYVGVGPGGSYLMSAVLQDTKFNPTSGSGVSGAAIDLKENYHSVLCTAIGVAGVKFKAGSLLIQFEARFQYGLMNVVNPSKRTNNEATFDYVLQSNDFRQSNMAFNGGIIYPVFRPKKL